MTASSRAPRTDSNPSAFPAVGRLAVTTRASRGVRRLLAAACLIPLCSCGPDVPEGLSDAIDRAVRAEMESNGVTGVAVGVARGSRVVHRAGYGFADVENRIPVTPETIFNIGSITKQFTAALILELVDEGALALDEPITDYLTGYPGYGPEVTVESLLTHTSGIKNYTTMQRWWETLAVEMPPRRLISVFESEPFDFRPGSRFSYSNSGYIVLGWLAEQVVGQPYGGMLNERLFVPLELSSTSYCDDQALVPNRARGYVVQDGEVRHATYVSMSQAYAAGAVCSNVDDLLRWTQLLARGGVLGRDGYRAMTTPATLGDGTQVEYGYGMSIGYLEGHHRVGHVGGMLGFSSQIARYDDDDVTIVVLTNTESARASAIEGEIARLLLGLGDQEIKDILLSPEELAQYTGTYDMTLTTVTIRASDGHLTTEVPVPGVQGSHTMLFQGDETFISRSDPDVYATFTRRDGRADGFVLTHKGITMRGVLIAP
ncbi:MAG: serine hydrolase [Gemmatimonadales bacterium]